MESTFDAACVATQGFRSKNSEISVVAHFICSIKVKCMCVNVYYEPQYYHHNCTIIISSNLKIQSSSFKIIYVCWCWCLFGGVVVQNSIFDIFIGLTCSSGVMHQKHLSPQQRQANMLIKGECRKASRTES